MSIFDIFKALEKDKKEKTGLTPPEFIIAGLGNPGTQYENTRHNCGFMAAETLADIYKTPLKRLRFKSLTGEISIGGKRCLVMKPTTFMNNSGDAVEEAAVFYKIPPERILVIYDDISLDVGRLRIRGKGSDGGHNGMKSIILRLNSDNFPRIRIGVGKKPNKDYDLADWVLSRFTKEEGEKLETALSNSAKAAELIVEGKINEAMNIYNRA
ncbi:MAG: aminoacyl-tRNA hydrolase [Ruminiclostridium sp.]|nr:aminoacyl-tRNA hydrolase [Ruminiclostridium sp.]